MMLGSKGLLTPLIPDCSALRALTILKNIRNPLIFLRKMASYSCFWRVPRSKILLQASLRRTSDLLTLVSCHFVKQVRTPPVRPADGVVGCVYESFVPGVWHRWMEKEILWFCFRRAEPERMISGWTASSRDSSKTEEGKAPRGYGQIRSELRMSSKLKLSRILPL